MEERKKRLLISCQAGDEMFINKEFMKEIMGEYVNVKSAKLDVEFGYLDKHEKYNEVHVISDLVTYFKISILE